MQKKYVISIIIAVILLPVVWFCVSFYLADMHNDEVNKHFKEIEQAVCAVKVGDSEQELVKILSEYVPNDYESNYNSEDYTTYLVSKSAEIKGSLVCARTGFFALIHVINGSVTEIPNCKISYVCL